MSLEVGLFLLRLLAALSLMSFLLALFLYMWRDLRRLGEAQAPGPAFGRLTRWTEGGGPKQPTETYPLLPVTRLGRAEGNHIVLRDEFASAEHALIRFEGGSWWLEDLRSRNGTLLNDALVKGRATLAAGDIIGIGSQRFRLELDGGPAKDGGD